MTRYGAEGTFTLIKTTAFRMKFPLESSNFWYAQLYIVYVRLQLFREPERTLSPFTTDGRFNSPTRLTNGVPGLLRTEISKPAFQATRLSGCNRKAAFLPMDNDKIAMYALVQILDQPMSIAHAFFFHMLTAQ